MWRDSFLKRRKRYLYLLKDTGIYYDTALRCLKISDSEGTESSEDEKVIADVSTCVLAPVMNAYMIWVLKAALKKKINRLYFLARDGYFMYTTAKMICERSGIPVECRYLSCSRYSIRIPMFHFNMSEALDYITRGGIDVTLDKVLNRAGLEESDKADIIQDIGNEFGEGVIPYADLSKLRTRLEMSEAFITAVKSHSEKAFPAARDYLEQEGLFEDVNYAFVDSGWTGSMQKVIGQLLDRCGHAKKLHGFYWGLYELPPDVNADDYECFYFGPSFGVRRKVEFSNCLFESIFSAPHGMTIGYQKNGKRVVPVYADIREKNKIFNEITGKYLERFTGELSKAAFGDNKPAEFPDTKKPLCSLGRYRFVNKNMSFIENLKNPEKKDVIGSLLGTFMGKPARHEAFVYGSLPFSDDVLDENEQPVAAEMTAEELFTNHPLKKIMILTGFSKDVIRESAWYEGSAVRNGEDTDKHLSAYRTYKWLLYGKKEAVRIKARVSR